MMRGEVRGRRGMGDITTTTAVSTCMQGGRVRVGRRGGKGDDYESGEGRRHHPHHEAPPTTAMSNCSWGGKGCYVSGTGG